MTHRTFCLLCSRPSRFTGAVVAISCESVQTGAREAAGNIAADSEDSAASVV